MAHQHSAASAGHRRRGAAVADSTNFDAARWPASAEETARAARRRRWRGDPATRDLLKQRRFNTTGPQLMTARWAGWGRDPAAGRAIRPGLAQFGTLCFWHAGAGPAGRVLSSVLVRPTGPRQSDRCLEVYSNYKQCRTSRKSHGITVLYLLGESAG